MTSPTGLFVTFRSRSGIRIIVVPWGVIRASGPAGSERAPPDTTRPTVVRRSKAPPHVPPRVSYLYTGSDAGPARSGAELYRSRRSVRPWETRTRDARGRFGRVVASVAGPSIGDPVLVGSADRPARRVGLPGLPSGVPIVADTSSPWEPQLFAVSGAVRRVSGVRTERIMNPSGAPASGFTGVGLAVLAAGGLAVQALAVRMGTADRRVGDVLTVVFAVNLLVIVPVAAFTTRPPYGLTPSAIGAFVVAGILGSLLGRACYYVGIARLGASRAEPLRALLPLFAVGTAVVVLDEPITPLLFGGVLLLVVGGVTVAAEARTSPVTADGPGLRLDIAFPLAAALLYGIDPVVTKLGFAEGASAMAGLAVRTVAGAAGFGAYLAWRAAREGRRPSVSVDRWTVVAGLANTGYLLAYYAALVRAPVVVVTPVMSLSTLFVVVGAAALLHEAEGVTRRLVGAATLVVLGAVIVAQG